MAAKPKKPREFPTHYATGAAEQAATASDEWFIDIEGPKAADGSIAFATAYRVIRNRKSGEALECKYLSEDEACDLASRLNAGEPLNRLSFGRLNVPGRIKKKGRGVSPAEWVTFLVTRPESAKTLRDALQAGRVLSFDDVRELMTFPREVEWLQLPTAQPAAATGRAAFSKADDEERKLVASVLQRLRNDFGLKTNPGNPTRDAKRFAKKLARGDL